MRGTNPTKLLVPLMLLSVLSRLGAVDLFVEAGGQAGNADSGRTSASRPAYVRGLFGVEHEAGDFSFLWELSASTENRWPESFMGDFYGDFSIEIARAGMVFSPGPFTFRLGRLEHGDVVPGPYGLFAPGGADPFLLAEIGYEDENFFFLNRWLGLNALQERGIYSSSVAPDYRIDRDRGAVLKTYGFKRGGLRFGFQDASVFTGRYFDLDFFANPAPGFFVQYVASAAGRPWSKDSNDNSLLGFFASWEEGDFLGYAQVLVDDFNMNRFLDPEASPNPDKLALSAGARLATEFGRFGFYAAGATRYTFSSIGGEYYSYTRYPGSAVLTGTGRVAIPIEEEMLGLRLGENSLGLLADWRAPGGRLGFLREPWAELELTLSGAKSPANPWHGGEAWGPTRWLDDPVLEVRLDVRAGTALDLGPLRLALGGELGYVWNRLALAEPATPVSAGGNREPVWKPSADSGPVAELSLGLSYRFGL